MRREVGPEHHAHHALAHGLSGGERKRIEEARVARDAEAQAAVVALERRLIRVDERELGAALLVPRRDMVCVAAAVVPHVVDDRGDDAREDHLAGLRDALEAVELSDHPVDAMRDVARVLRVVIRDWIVRSLHLLEKGVHRVERDAERVAGPPVTVVQREPEGHERVAAGVPLQLVGVEAGSKPAFDAGLQHGAHDLFICWRDRLVRPKPVKEGGERGLLGWEE